MSLAADKSHQRQAFNKAQEIVQHLKGLSSKQQIASLQQRKAGEGEPEAPEYKRYRELKPD